ncbi:MULTISPECIES: PfkB family carbohydrate kinase [Alphaproteobacteria]|uniref:Ribokinase n=2 Tax=Alphaproteobacteria TaxID=28211 RepID=A0A512HJ89_9HYPH|nr:MULTISPECIES: PfkB family carbohydrate kinase [Alphaproteobacteria]GEO85516.1 ribokinase [Ciceribacter naphthalenivorans]GLR21462.1 ribokinase [Ciceribacter naphthalenivorans]GLT04318.1 ribokinase [Sphingomonas psychrolutea]
MRTSLTAASGSIIVIGHINHDRIWRLNGPLRSGARISWSDRRVRLGGGGYYTARRLMDLGHSASLVATLRDDRLGRWALDALTARHFDLTHVDIAKGETECADILLEPNGERTILSSQKRISRSFSLSAPIKGEAFYVNGAHLCDNIVQSLDKARLVVSQFPLGNPTPRPADVMVGSKADFPGQGLEEIWQAASRIGGSRLKQLALTDGPHEITLFDGGKRQDVHIPHPVSTGDTIGAGDSFSAAILHALIGGAGLAEAAQWAGDATARWLLQRDAIAGTDWADEPA